MYNTGTKRTKTTILANSISYTTWRYGY